MICPIIGGTNAGAQPAIPERNPVNSDGEDIYEPPSIAPSESAYTDIHLTPQYDGLYVGTNAEFTAAANTAL